MEKVKVQKEKYKSSLRKGLGKKYAKYVVNADNTTRFDRVMSEK